MKVESGEETAGEGAIREEPRVARQTPPVTSGTVKIAQRGSVDRTNPKPKTTVSPSEAVVESPAPPQPVPVGIEGQARHHDQV